MHSSRYDDDVDFGISSQFSSEFVLISLTFQYQQAGNPDSIKDFRSYGSEQICGMNIMIVILFSKRVSKHLRVCAGSAL